MPSGCRLVDFCGFKPHIRDLSLRGLAELGERILAPRTYEGGPNSKKEARPACSSAGFLLPESGH